jgi:Pentapeptide repeats (8 copies)
LIWQCRRWHKHSETGGPYAGLLQLAIATLMRKAKQKWREKMKFEIKNRFSGQVQFTAEIECEADTSYSMKIGLAVKWALKSGANLGSADLGGADLRGANLRGADLGGANLGGQWIIQGPTRSDGYQFFLMRLKDETIPMVRAGCCWFDLVAARQHWQETRGGTLLGDETMSILDWLETAAKIRGLK